MPMRLIVALAIALWPAASAAQARERVLIRYGTVVIETIVEGAGPAVVLLPSLARDSEDDDAVADQLARRGLRVLRPQPRGMGRSTGPLDKITLHDLARDVAEVIRQLGGGRAVVVGHAYGNFVARMTAVDHPALVRGVVIAAAAAKQYDPSLRTLAGVLVTVALVFYVWTRLRPFRREPSGLATDTGFGGL